VLRLVEHHLVEAEADADADDLEEAEQAQDRAGDRESVDSSGF
jgi:hypothetical protein